MINYNNVALIPVRGGSKSIPLKNIKKIAGKPLVQWTIEAAINSEVIDHVYVSTDSDEIRSVVESLGFKKVTVIDRSLESATDTAPTEMALIEFANNYIFNNIILIQATSPLLTSYDLDSALEKFIKGNYDSLLSVVRQKRFIWKEQQDIVVPVNYDPKCRPRRQEFKGYLVENGAFYITKRDLLINSGCRISGRIGYHEMAEDSYLEIDEASDWKIVESLLKNKKTDNHNLMEKLKKIKLFITDCDGVLTDGGMYYSENGDELKKFNTKDGMGLSLLKKLGIRLAIITGEDVQIVRNRANKMRIDDVFCGIKNKLEVLNILLEKYNLTYEEVSYVGDDINDLEVMKRVGVAFSVNDAMDQVKEVADYVTKKNGGNGAIREICELFLKR